jgi:hypothetical protein
MILGEHSLGIIGKFKIKIKIKIEQVIPFSKTLHSINPSAMGFKGIELPFLVRPLSFTPTHRSQP